MALLIASVWFAIVSPALRAEDNHPIPTVETASVASADEGSPELGFLPVASPVSNVGNEIPAKRLFGVIPNYKADRYQDVYAPLTAKEKFTIARRDSFDWPNFFVLAGYAMQAQVAAGGFKNNGGIAGFSEYYGRGLGDQVIGNYLTEAIMPTMLHEDPRYFRLGKGGFWRRSTHAGLSIVVTRKDSGRYGFNISEVIGNVGVVALTSLYYSDSQTAIGGLERYGMQLGNDTISNMITEFWPDVKRNIPFLHKKF